MEGWIKLHRRLSENPLWLAEPFTPGQAWVDLLILASHKDTCFWKRGIKIEQSRGQVGVSIKGLASRWRWSQGKVKRFLKLLKSEEQIEEQNTKLTTLITVVNYDAYQKKKEQNGERTENKRRTNGDNQECKECKEEHTVPSSDEPEDKNRIDPDEEIYKKCSLFLKTIVEEKKNVHINGHQINSWSKQFRLLITKDKVSKKRVKDALSFYKKNIDEQYVPTIESGETFRRKIIKLENAMKRISATEESCETCRYRKEGACKKTKLCTAYQPVE